MPQAAQEHREQQISVGLTFSVAITSQRDVEVVTQPGAQADVPAAPEVLQAGREVRLAEIDHEVEAHELRAAPRDVAVAAEIAVDLPGEGIGANRDDRQARLSEMTRERRIGQQAQLSATTHFRNKPKRISMMPSKK